MVNMDESWKAVERLFVYVAGIVLSATIAGIAASLSSPCLAVIAVISCVVFLVLWVLTLRKWKILHKQDLKNIDEMERRWKK